VNTRETARRLERALEHLERVEARGELQDDERQIVSMVIGTLQPVESNVHARAAAGETL